MTEPDHAPRRRPLPPPTEPPKPSGVVRFALGTLVALFATGAYVGILLPELGFAPAIPLHAGCGLFLVLLWSIPLRGRQLNWQRTFKWAVAAFGLIILGALNLHRAEEALRSEYAAMRLERTALTDGRKFYSANDDPFGKELEEASHFPLISIPGGFRLDLSGRAKMIRLIEEKQPGWPRALDHFIRRNLVEMPERKKDDENSEYGSEPRMGCGHYWGRGLGLSSYNFYSYAVKVERRLLDRANEDREVFLQLWKKLPPEERGETAGK